MNLDNEEEIKLRILILLEEYVTDNKCYRCNGTGISQESIGGLYCFKCGGTGQNKEHTNDIVNKIYNLFQ